MGFEMGCQIIQRLLNGLIEGETGGVGSQRFEEGVAETIGGEAAVEIGSRHQHVSAHCAFWAIWRLGEQALAIRPCGLTQMDFISRDQLAGEGVDGLGFGGGFIGQRVGKVMGSYAHVIAKAPQ